MSLKEVFICKDTQGCIVCAASSKEILMNFLKNSANLITPEFSVSHVKFTFLKQDVFSDILVQVVKDVDHMLNDRVTEHNSVYVIERHDFISE